MVTADAGQVDDVARLREAFAPVEDRARTQHWDDKRPWRVETHIGWEGPLPVIDLHDLKAGAAKAGVSALLEMAAGLDTGAVVLVTGRGRHSVGPGGVLGKVVRSNLGKACAAREGWTLRPMGPARWVLITDRSKAPKAATGDFGWGMWLLLAGFVLAVIVVVLSKLFGS